MDAHRLRLLNCGITIPVLGFGTYSCPNDDEKTEAAIRLALKVHYIYVDYVVIVQRQEKAPLLAYASHENVQCMSLCMQNDLMIYSH